MFDLIGTFFIQALSIEFVELLHYSLYKTNRFRFSVRVYFNRSQKTPMACKEQNVTALDFVSCDSYPMSYCCGANFSYTINNYCKSENNV